LIPKRGVYAVYVHINEDVFQGVMNIGTRPTFGAGRVFYEVHILDFDGDIYHIPIKVEFIDRIRDERRFSSVHELKDQITKDVSKTREILSSFSLKE
jgi:riboflavin kinase/FMN adenylyltransferase